MNRTTVKGKVATSTSDGYFTVEIRGMMVCTICWCVVLNECRKDHRRVCQQPFDPTLPSPYTGARNRMRGGTD